MNQFRVGCFYRQSNGVVANVLSQDGATIFVGTAWAPEGKKLHGGGGRNVNTGKYTCWTGARDDEYTLIPGELHQVNGEWVPIPSKLSSLTEPNCAEQEDLWAAKCQPAHVSHVEPEREALPHFNQRTPFDSFKGFTVVDRKTFNTDAAHAGSGHALQRMNDGTDALHGSAFLRG